MGRSRSGLLAVSLILAAWAACPAQATVPQVIKIQGYLVDDQGVPIDGQVSITFDLYDAANGGTLINSVGPMIVQVSNGIYNADLGFVPADFPGEDRFLQHTVEGEVLLPRTRLASMPYAYRAEDGARGATGPVGPPGPTGPPGVDGQDGAADPDQQEIKDKLCEISTELSLPLPSFCTPPTTCPCEGLSKGAVVWDSSFPTDSCNESTPTDILLFGTGSFKRLAALGDVAQFNCNVWDGVGSPNAVAYETAEEAQACADSLTAIAAEDGVACN